MLWLLCFFGGYAHRLNAQVEHVESERCVAEPGLNYFTPLNLADEQTSELCFIRLSEIDGDADQYLRINVTSRSTASLASTNAIHLPAWQVKTKPYLKKKPLLIYAEPYKRHLLAKLCNELIQNGFQNPKILLGDNLAENGSRQSTSVPVDDFIVEISNFGAVTIASNQKVASELAALGIPAITADANLKVAVRNAVVDYSLNGFLPVFLVGESKVEVELIQLLSENPTSPAFVVSGGIESISRALKTSALSSVKRFKKHGVPSCVG